MRSILKNFTGLITNEQTEVDFQAVYHLEMPRIFNFFRYRVGDDQLAEDLTSQTFEKAWRNKNRYRHDIASFSTWLFVIARRVALDHFQRSRPTIPLDDAEHLADSKFVEDIAQQHAEFAHLSELLARLAERERELVALKYGAGLTNRAIANISGLSESNVSTILHRVILQLRSQMENET